MSPDLIALFQVLRMQSLPISHGAKLTNYGLLKNVRSSLSADLQRHVFVCSVPSIVIRTLRVTLLSDSGYALTGYEYCARIM